SPLDLLDRTVLRALLAREKPQDLPTGLDLVADVLAPGRRDVDGLPECDHRLQVVLARAGNLLERLVDRVWCLGPFRLESRRASLRLVESGDDSPLLRGIGRSAEFGSQILFLDRLIRDHLVPGLGAVLESVQSPQGDP